MTLQLPVVVSRHAIEQARMRYRRPDWGWQEIKLDVEQAIAAGRVGKHAAGCTGKPKTGGRFCWTGCGRRVYLIKRRNGRPEYGAGRVWVVITAYIPDHVKEAV